MQAVKFNEAVVILEVTGSQKDTAYGLGEAIFKESFILSSYIIIHD